MSINRFVVKSAFFSLILAAGALAQAQQIVPDGKTIYRLNDTATFQQGCFDPCLCPVGQELSIRGTFVLGPVFPGDVVDFREVSQVTWKVVFGGDIIHTITGSGSYRVTNFDPSQQHALNLELSIDGAEPQHFFSDFAPVSANDGSLDLTVSINGVYCFDTVIRVDVSPVPADEIKPYKLANGSTYQIACFDPCDCVSQEPRPMRGNFSLVPIIDFGTYAEFSLVDARFGVRSPSVVDAMLTLTGFGNYKLVQGFAGPAHEMELNLILNGDLPLKFDQELDNTDTQFPAIDIVVDTNDRVCTDTLLTLKARPAASLGPAAGLPRLPPDPVTPRQPQ